MSRRGRQRRHHEQEGTKTRVPIIPMLDMAFQLLAFGLSTFELAQIFEEGQFSMALPSSGDAAPAVPTEKLEEPTEDYMVRVTADRNGRIDTISYALKSSNSAATPDQLKALPSGGKELGLALRALVEAKEKEGKPTPKLDVQFDPDMSYQVVFEVLSAADTAKFKKVSPNLLTKLAPGPAMP